MMCKHNLNIKQLTQKIIQHIAVKANFRLGKLCYTFKNSVGLDFDKIHTKRIIKFVDDKPIHVFLNISLSEIDTVIKTDEIIRNIIMNEAELALNNTWLILNRHRENMFDATRGHYRWTEDFVSGYVFPDCFFSDVRAKVVRKDVDIKIPWETARMQYLFSLALAYRATKDEKYADKIVHIIRDFILCCPVDTGANWNVSMEVGIRLANIVLACELIQDSKAFSNDFKTELAIISFQHMRHIRRYIENEKNAGNHYLADLLGIATAVSAFPHLPKAAKNCAYAEKSLCRELKRQILPDGSDFEGSTSYHRLVGELLCFTVIALEKGGYVLSQSEKERLGKMSEFTQSIRMRNGLVPQIGDNDSGRVFLLSPENTRDHDSFLNLCSFVIERSMMYPPKKDGFFCFYGSEIPHVRNRDRLSRLMYYKDFSLIRYDNDKCYLAMCGTMPDAYGKSGHSHNDLLSFVLTIGDEEFVVDPGSGLYTGNINLRNNFRSVTSHSTISVDGQEQRVLSTQNAFMWLTSAKVTLEVYDTNDDLSVFGGKCSYLSNNGQNTEHSRKICITENQVSIEDNVVGIRECCRLYLPLSPNVSVASSEKGFIVSGNKTKLEISGAWNFQIIETLYSNQYGEIVHNSTIVGMSKFPTNRVDFKIII